MGQRSAGIQRVGARRTGTVTTIGSGGQQLPIGTLQEGDVLYRISNAIAGKPVFATWGTSIAYCCVDTAAGNDSTGVISTTEATAAASPFQSWAGALVRVPLLGVGAALCFLIKTGTYAENLVFRGYRGYRLICIHASSDLTNSATDKLLSGFATATGADASYTCSGGATVSSVPTGGTLPADPAFRGKRIRFDAATSTASLRNVCRDIYSAAGGAVTVGVDLPAVPTNTDTFHIEQPGAVFNNVTIEVADGFISDPPVDPGATSGGALVFQIRGINTGGTFTLRGNARATQIVGCEATGNLLYQMSGGDTLVNIKAMDEVTGANGNQIGAGIRCSRWATVSRPSVAELSVDGLYCVSSSANNWNGFIQAAFGSQAPCYFGGVVNFNSGGLGSMPDALGNGLVTFGNLGTASIRPTLANGNGFVFVNGSASINGCDVINAGANAVVKLTTGVNLSLDGLTSSAGGNTGVVLDVSAAHNARVVCGVTAAISATATGGDIKLAGGAITTFAGLATTNVRDAAGNHVFGTGGEVVGQCTQFTNVDGTALVVGEVVRGNAVANQVVRAKADTAANATGPLWVAVTPPANNAAGFFVAINSPQKWVLHDAAPTLDGLSYISPGTAGSATTTIPVVSGTNQKRRLGHVAKVSGSLGLVSGGGELLPVAADGLA